MGWNLNFRQRGRAAPGEGNQSFCDYLQMKRNRLERAPARAGYINRGFYSKESAPPTPPHPRVTTDIIG